MWTAPQRPRPLAALTLATALAGCGDDATLGADTQLDDAVTVDTSTPAARAQYDANVRFATGYAARCRPASNGRPRVLVTGFGRFLSNGRNATGEMVHALVPAARYPMTAAPQAGAVDAPEPQTSVATGTVRLAGVGDVDVCAMIVPVYWDLAAILAIKEIDAFAPDLVVMNGIAGPAQDLWIELGAVNRAMPLEDGSNQLVPRPPAGQPFAPLVPSASRAEAALGLKLSWSAVREAARGAIAQRGAVTEGGVSLGDVLTGARFGGFPRGSNTYLCNNIAYVVNYAMAHPSRTLTLLQASAPVRGATNRVAVRLQRDMRQVPRVFLHWPSQLAGAHLEAGADVLRAIFDAQLGALRAGRDLPTLGDNRIAELAPGGETY